MQGSCLCDGALQIGLWTVVAPMRMSTRLCTWTMVVRDSTAILTSVEIVSRACLRIRTMMVRYRCGRIVSVRCAIAVIMWGYVTMLMGRRSPW